MSETGQTGSGARRTSPHIDEFCDALRDGLQSVADALTPPESACNHFNEARLEFLRGVRDIIDHRIDRVWRKNANRGTRVVVE